MKKIFRFVLPVILCLFCFAVPVSADKEDFTYPYVVDDAQLITTDNAKLGELNDKLWKLSEKYDLDIVIVTTDSLGEKSPQAFADDFYDYNGYKKDGILFLISMEYRDWAISTTGKGIDIFTDSVQSEIVSEMKPSLSVNDFETAFNIFADECAAQLSHQKTMGIVIPICVAVVVGLIAALIVTMILKHQLASVNFQRNADSYVDKKSVRITQNQNIFLYKTLSKTRKESSSSSGGSSTHTSSSGSTHGGSSGKF